MCRLRSLLVKLSSGKDIYSMDRILLHVDLARKHSENLQLSNYNIKNIQDRLIYNENMGQEICSICQEILGHEDPLTKISCGHEFHTQCFTEMFFQQNIQKCPNCNAVEDYENVRDIVVEGELIDANVQLENLS